jgi:hypothetical protein
MQAPFAFVRFVVISAVPVISSHLPSASFGLAPVIDSDSQLLDLLIIINHNDPLTTNDSLA